MNHKKNLAESYRNKSQNETFASEFQMYLSCEIALTRF